MEVRRLGAAEAGDAAEAVAAADGPRARSRTSEAALRRLLVSPENVFLAALAEGEPAGFLLAHRLDRPLARRRSVTLGDAAAQ